MACTKNTARKQHLGLPKARFPAVPTGQSERDLHYKAQLQLPSEDADWTTLMPTLMGTESPEVGRAIERINAEHANSPPQTINEVCALVQDLQANPPTPPQSKIQSCKWTVSCQPQLHHQLPPCSRKQWQKLYTHP